MIERLAFLAFVFLMPLASARALPAADRLGDDAMERAAEKLIREDRESRPAKASARAAAAKAAPAADAEAREDEDVPLAAAEPVKSKGGGSLVWRLLASVAVLAAAGVALHVFARRYTGAKNVGGAQTRIEMLHQYPLGPRKSLGLVRVAGEVMLVGITDHNVSMIKTINLIDDDMAAAINQDFNGFLDDEFAVSDAGQFGRRDS